MIATSAITVAGTGFPWLTVAGGIPLVGAILVSVGPARLTRWLTLAFSLITLIWVIVMATQYKTSGPTFQFTESTPGSRSSACTTRWAWMASRWC